MHWYDCQGKNKTGRWGGGGAAREIWGRGMRIEWERNVKMFFTHVNAQQGHALQGSVPVTRGQDDRTVPVRQPFSSATPVCLLRQSAGTCPSLGCLAGLSGCLTYQQRRPRVS